MQYAVIEVDLIDIVVLADHIIEEFKDNGGYSEISDDELRHVLTKYLENEYKKELQRLKMQLQLEIGEGEDIADERYKAEFNLIQRKLEAKARLLATTGKNFS